MSKYDLLAAWQDLHVDESLLRAFDEIDREQFVPPKYRHMAYEDRPLPTIRKQSISQPSTIMLMLQALELKQGDSVLEVGAGVGYQAALLSKIVGPTGNVIAVDVIPELVHIARLNTQGLSLPNVLITEADGSEGYKESAPYDRIIITAACPTIPEPIIEQLKEGGIVVAPVGNLDSQNIVKGTKVDGQLSLQFLGSFRFVPLKGKYGFNEIETLRMR